MIDRDTVKQLAAAEEPWAASLYLPKHEQDGKFVYDPIDARRRENELENLMGERGLSAADRRQFHTRLEGLLQREHFYNRYQPGTLALFVSPTRQEAIDVPLALDGLAYLSGEFFLRPIVTLLNDLERFLVLTLGPDSVYLYEGNPSSLVQSANLTPFSETDGEPERLGDAHTEIPGTAPPLQVQTYLRKVDDRLRRTVDDQQAPLIVAGPEWLCTLYGTVSRYGNILPKGIAFQPEKDDREALFRRAKPLIEAYARERKADKRRSFIQEMLRNNASISLTDILTAAVEGRVAALYLDKDEQRSGVFKPRIKFAKVGETHEQGGETALFNLAAIKTFLRDGQVYDLPREDLPDTTTAINATFRGGDGNPDYL